MPTLVRKWSNPGRKSEKKIIINESRMINNFGRFCTFQFSNFYICVRSNNAKSNGLKGIILGVSENNSFPVFISLCSKFTAIISFIVLSL